MYKTVILILLFFNCNNTSTSKEENITGIKVTQVFPNMTPKGKVTGYDTLDVKIFYYQDYALYYLVYRYDSTVNDIKLISEDRYHYVFHKKGDSHGYDYDKHKSPRIRIVPMDSIYKIEGIFQTNPCPTFSKFSTTLVWSHKNDSTGISEEYYKVKGIEDTSMSGTCYLEFTNKMKDVEFSLCKEVDSIKKMKLQKITTVNNPRYFSAGGFYIDRAEIGYTLERIKNFDSTEIKSLFGMFIKEQQSIK